jgi:hypothetical protein
MTAQIEFLQVYRIHLLPGTTTTQVELTEEGQLVVTGATLARVEDLVDLSQALLRIADAIKQERANQEYVRKTLVESALQIAEAREVAEVSAKVAVFDPGTGPVPSALVTSLPQSE